MAGTRFRTLTLLVCLAQPAAAAAHGVGIECTHEPETGVIRVAAFYTDDTPASAARITVADVDGRTVARGQADDRGLWSFPRPSPGVYQVEADAGRGHRKRIYLTIPEDPDQAPRGDEPSRAAFTRFPWLGLLLGLASLTLLAAVARRGLRRRADSA